MSQLSVAVVDPEPTYAYGILSYLGQECENAQLIGHASSISELHNEPKVTSAGVFIISWDLVGREEAQVLSELVNRDSNPKRIVAVCQDTKIQTIVSAFAVGATAIVLRNGPLDEIVRAIRAISAGKRYVCPAIGLAVLERLADFIDDTLTADRPDISALSNREREVLALIAKGFTSKEIAQALTLSVRTIENHRTNIMRRLEIHSTIGLARYVVATELTGVE